MDKQNIKWDFSYVLTDDRSGLNTIQYIPHPLFEGREGRYTSDEVSVVIKFIHNYKVPQFNENLNGWIEFKEKLNQEIYNLFKK